jgi:hypothetical protein
MPEPSEIRQGNEKLPKKGTLDKYKWWLIGGLAVIAVLVFYFVNKSKQASATGTSSAAASGIDPTTGVPYSQEYANAYGAGMGMNPYGGFGGGFGGGGTGPAGPAGPAGKTGPRGKRGKSGGGGGDHKHHKEGSRTEAMSAAVSARRAWNTRIIPPPNRHSYYV